MELIVFRVNCYHLSSLQKLISRALVNVEMESYVTAFMHGWTNGIFSVRDERNKRKDQQMNSRGLTEWKFIHVCGMSSAGEEEDVLIGFQQP